MITGNAVEIQKFRDDVNSELSKLGSANSNSANMWLIARPVQEVMVNMILTMTGSDDIGHNRSMKPIVLANRIRPTTSAIKALTDVDDLNPSQYIIDTKTSATCEVITGECLKALKDAGLLDGQLGEITKNFGPTSLTGETLKDAIEGALAASILKIRLENKIAAKLKGGIVITTRQKVVERSVINPARWFGSKYTTIETERDNTDFEKLLEDEEAFNRLSSTPVVENIKIQYQISMVDTIDGVSDSIDMAQYLTIAQIGESSLVDANAAQRGTVEIPLPIKSEQVSEDNFLDLTLSDYVGGFKRPIFKDKEPDQVLMRVEDEFILSPIEERNLIQAAREKKSFDYSQLEERKREVAKKFYAYAINQLEIKAYDNALAAYNKQLDSYNTKVTDAREKRYSLRIIDHRRDLEKMLETLSGMDFDAYMKSMSDK